MKQQTNYVTDIHKLFSDAKTKVYPKNQLIHYQGDPLSNVYLIKKGFIKAYTILDSGDTRTILMLSKDDIFPLAFSATMDWANYQIKYFYQSMTDTELQVLPSEQLKSEIEADPNLLRIYMNYLAASNNAVMNQLEVMKNKKAIDKVSLLLPYLISKAGTEVKPGVYQLNLKLSHQEVADLSGVTRETTTTLIKQLEQEGVVNQAKGHWRINTANLEKALTLR